MHSSFRSLVDFEGSPDDVVNAYLDVGCTLVVPTFSWDEFFVDPPERRPVRNGWSVPLDRQSAPVFETSSTAIDAASMGAIPVAVVNRSDRVRGNHPLVSFSAVGPEASVVSLQDPHRPYAPLEELAQRGGAVVLAGVTLTSCTLIHLAELRAGRSPFIRWAESPDDGPMEALVGGCSAGFDALAPALAPAGRRLTVAGSRWIILDARRVLDLATRAILDEPTVTDCGDEACGRCSDAIAGGPLWE